MAKVEKPQAEPSKPKGEGQDGTPIPETWPGFSWMLVKTYGLPGLAAFAVLATAAAYVYYKWPSPPPKAASPSMHVETGSGPAFGIGGDVGGDVHVEVDTMPPAVIRSLEELLERGFENVDHPVIDFSKPVEKQVQLFPEDYVRIDGIDHGITEVNFGGGWRPFDAKDHYLVWGTMGQPVVPQFKGGRGGIKLEVRYRKNLDKPRALQFGDLPTRR